MVRVLFMTNSVKNDLQLLRPTLKWTIFSQLTRFDATHWQNFYFFLIGQFIYLDQIQFCILFLTLWKTGTPPVLFLAAVRRNAACVQAWSDFSHLQCIDQCSCPSLASLQWIAIASLQWIAIPNVCSLQWIAIPNVCIFCELYCLQYIFYAFCKPLCSNVLLPFLAVLTNLILFVFHVPNTYWITVYC